MLLRHALLLFNSQFLVQGRDQIARHFGMLSIVVNVTRTPRQGEAGRRPYLDDEYLVDQGQPRCDSAYDHHGPNTSTAGGTPAPHRAAGSSSGVLSPSSVSSFAPARRLGRADEEAAESLDG